MGSESATLERVSPLMRLREALATGAETPLRVAEAVMALANRNQSRNTYLWFDREWLLQQAEELERRFAGKARPPLYAVPVSLKDCFDLAGTVTSAGTKFYAQRLGEAARDSVVAERLKSAGMLITGKTHMHPLAYGITGENPDYGDCLQPRDARLLTGGSSSGAAASVQEGSAVVAIGTDTGGSVRVPAALCGVVGYRFSHDVAWEKGRWSEAPGGLWGGGIHLAQSFDTVGVFARDPRDVVTAVDEVFALGVEQLARPVRAGCVAGEFLADCDPEVRRSLEMWREWMVRAGVKVEEFAPEGWEGAQEVFAGIQAHEAARIHEGHLDVFEAAIAQRLRWGAGIGEGELRELRGRMAEIRGKLGRLWEKFDFVMLPCAPVAELRAGEDQTGARGRILKYTTPFSLAGMPALALPGELLGGPRGTGVQIGAHAGGDRTLLGLAQWVGTELVEGNR